MEQTKLIFSKSLNHPSKDREEYLERRVRYFKSFGVIADHAHIVKLDFGLSVYQFMNTKKERVTNRIRKYLYKRRGSYNNNRGI